MSTTFAYTPDDEQKIHTPGAIALICRPFQSHEHGLPEWAKNSADAYARESSPLAKRVIVILTSDRKKFGPPTIACLDFVGTNSSQIEKYFRHWADPDAASQGKHVSVQGGHGNGGKCYMTQMFTEYSFFHSAKGTTALRYGVKGGSAKFGYVPDRKTGRNYKIESVEDDLETGLASLGVKTSTLPQEAQEALKSADGFSLVVGVGPKNYETKIKVGDLIDQIRDHPQMLTTLEFAKVFVLHNGKPVKDASPLTPSKITPIPGADDRVITIPAHLTDPDTGESYSTTENDKFSEGALRLLTSKKSMRYKKRKSRHTMNYRSSSGGFFGYRHMLEFPVESGYRDKIYGEITLDSLEHFKQNDRGRLANAPLSRAVDHFIAEEVQKFAEEFEALDKKDYTKKERNALSRMNEALDRWKNRFIRNYLVGTFGEGGGTGRGEKLPSGKPARLEIVASYPRLGIGVAIRPRIRFFDATGRQIRPVPFRWISEDPNIALVDDDLMLINSFSAGSTVVYAETTDTTLQSNRIPLEVIRIRSIELSPPSLEVAAGSRTQLTAQCKLSSGEIADDVALVWTEGNSTVARVSSNGLVFGINPGSTEVTAGDDSVTSPTARIVVVEGKEDGGRGKGKGGKGPGKNTGRGYPLILVSGPVDVDPETKEFVNFSPDDPPVQQRPQDADRNIWWINSAAPLAALY